MEILWRMRNFIPQTLGGTPDNVWNNFVYWRYPSTRQLIRWVRKVRPRRIMEIGVYRGRSAEKMIKTAKSAGVKNPEYYGFDLFEKPPEYEGKYFGGFPPLEEVRSRLQKTKAKIFLLRGNTCETLPREIRNLPKMDFIYIDGGHSYKTVKNDWENARKLMHAQTIVVFDDYDVEKGVTKLVNEINDYHVEIQGVLAIVLPEPTLTHPPI